jgi:tetratricopeptide (TPR) repeat protein
MNTWRAGITAGARRMPAISAALVGGLLAVTLAFVPAGYAAEKDKDKDKAEAQQPLSPEVGKILRPANEAAQKGDYDTAIAGAREALKIATKPNDREQSAKVLSYAAAKKNDLLVYAEGAEVLNTLDSVTPAEKLKNYENLTKIYYQNKMTDKALEAAKKWVEAGGGADAYTFLAAQYLNQKDCVNYIATMDKAPSSGPPTEAQLNNRIFCYQQLGEKDKITQLAEQMYIQFPSRKTLLWERDAARPKQGGDERPLLNVYRFGFDHDLLESALEINEYAELAASAGAVEEAEAALNRGVSRHLTSGDAKTNKQLAEVRRSAGEDKKGLPALDREAKAGKSGLKDVAVGVAYFGLGQYDKAAEALDRGLQPDRVGSTKNLDDVHMLLGISYLKLNRRADAEKAFAAVNGDHVMIATAKAWLAAPPAAAGAAAAPGGSAAPAEEPKQN